MSAEFVVLCAHNEEPATGAQTRKISAAFFAKFACATLYLIIYLDFTLHVIANTPAQESPEKTANCCVGRSSGVSRRSGQV
jgi:hypothetical protein